MNCNYFVMTCLVLSFPLGEGPRGPLAQPSNKQPTYKGKSLDGWVKALRDSNPSTRREGAEALGEFGPKAEAAVPALIKALGDRDDQVRMLAAQALGRVGKATVPDLLRALK